MKFDESDFEIIKEKAEVLYGCIKDTYCPYFGGHVCFNTKGWEHLRFKRHDKPRPETDQYMRLKLLHLAPEILKQSHTLQGKLEIRKFERIRIHSRTETVLKYVTYYEFIALIKRDRVKVIVKQIEEGELFFWSIIPFWGMDRESSTRLLHDGSPEED